MSVTKTSTEQQINLLLKQINILNAKRDDIIPRKRQNEIWWEKNRSKIAWSEVARYASELEEIERQKMAIEREISAIKSREEKARQAELDAEKAKIERDKAFEAQQKSFDLVLENQVKAAEERAKAVEAATKAELAAAIQRTAMAEAQKTAALAAQLKTLEAEKAAVEAANKALMAGQVKQTEAANALEAVKIAELERQKLQAAEWEKYIATQKAIVAGSVEAATKAEAEAKRKDAEENIIFGKTKEIFETIGPESSFDLEKVSKLQEEQLPEVARAGLGGTTLLALAGSAILIYMLMTMPKPKKRAKK